MVTKFNVSMVLGDQMTFALAAGRSQGSVHPPTTNRTVVIVDREAPREGEHRAVHGESSVILLHPPSTFSRCINSDGERASGRIWISR